MGTERRLLEEARNKSMVLHIVDVLLLQRTFAATLAQINFLLLLLGHVVVVGHGDGRWWDVCVGWNVFYIWL